MDYTIYYRYVKNVLKIGRQGHLQPDSAVKENSDMRLIPFSPHKYAGAFK